jgi:hypothetical protein
VQAASGQQHRFADQPVQRPAASQCVRDVGDSGDSKEQQPAYDDLDEPLYFHHHNLLGSDAELDVDMTITEKQVAGH